MVLNCRSGENSSSPARISIDGNDRGGATTVPSNDDMLTTIGNLVVRRIRKSESYGVRYIAEVSPSIAIWLRQ